MFLFILIPLAAFAGLIGEGCDRLRDTALKYALEDLASQIEVRVSSEFYSQKSTYSEGFARYYIRTETNLPIFAYKTETLPDCVRVSFDEKKAPAAYAGRAEELAKEINALTKPSNDRDSVRSVKYMKALPLYDELSKVAAVARFLEVETASPERNVGEIEAELAALRKSSDDIEQIAVNIKDTISYKNYYVYPPVITGTTAVTPFGAALAKLLSTGVSLENARHILNCEYDPVNGNFLVVCVLRDKLGKPVETAVSAADIKVCDTVSCEAGTAYKKLQALKRFQINANGAADQPQNGMSGLRGFFYTDKSFFGNEPLTLKGGDLLRLYARFSGDATAVVMGVTEDGSVFLLPLSEDSPVKKTAAGFETELIRVKIEPPFGVETLFLFGVSGSIGDYLPKYSYNASSGIYVINGSAGRVLADFRKAVRGIPFYEGTMLIYSEVGF
jgi:hypothetical protein